MVEAETDRDRALNNPAHWHRRAEEARRHATGLADPVAQQTLLAIAQAYEQLARNAEVSAAQPLPE